MWWVRFRVPGVLGSRSGSGFRVRVPGSLISPSLQASLRRTWNSEPRSLPELVTRTPGNLERTRNEEPNLEPRTRNPEPYPIHMIADHQRSTSSMIDQRRGVRRRRPAEDPVGKEAINRAVFPLQVDPRVHDRRKLLVTAGDEIRERDLHRSRHGHRDRVFRVEERVGGAAFRGCDEGIDGLTMRSRTPPSMPSIGTISACGSSSRTFRV